VNFGVQRHYIGVVDYLTTTTTTTATTTTTTITTTPCSKKTGTPSSYR